eukprot:1160681-Pelagomonas_calceolata.AAC.1
MQRKTHTKNDDIGTCQLTQKASTKATEWIPMMEKLRDEGRHVEGMEAGGAVYDAGRGTTGRQTKH